MHGDPAKARGPREHDAHDLAENEALEQSFRADSREHDQRWPPTAAGQPLTAAEIFEPDGELELDDDALEYELDVDDDDEPWADAPTSYYNRAGVGSPAGTSAESAELAADGDEAHAPAGAWTQHAEPDAPPEVWPAAPNETSRGMKRRASRSSAPPAPQPIPSLRHQHAMAAAPLQTAARSTPAPRFAPLGAAPPQAAPGHVHRPPGAAPPVTAGAAPHARSRPSLPASWPARHPALAHSLSEAVADPSHHAETSWSGPRSSGVHMRSPVRDSAAQVQAQAQAPAVAASFYLDSLVPQVRPAEPIRHAKRSRTWLWNMLATLPLCAAMAGLYMLWVRPSPAKPALAHASAPSAPSMPRAEPMTGFTIDSRPTGAEIRVDGRSLGAVTPARVTGLQPGLHSVELTLAGHLRAGLPVQISEGAVFDVPPIALHPEQPQPAAESAEVAPAPELSREARRAARAERRAAWLERREARKAKRDARRALSGDAEHTPQAVAAAPAQTPDPAPAELPEEATDRPAVLATAMPRNDDGPGMLRINSRPWSKIFVDDRFVGNTPQLALELEPGRHSIRLVNEPLGMAKTLLITIRSGETVTKIENLID